MKSKKTHQLTFAWLHIPRTRLFPHSNSDTAAPCGVPSIPGWVSCLMRRLDCPGLVFPITFFNIPALALSPLYSVKAFWKQSGWICRHSNLWSIPSCFFHQSGVLYIRFKIQKLSFQQINFMRHTFCWVPAYLHLTCIYRCYTPAVTLAVSLV